GVVRSGCRGRAAWAALYRLFSGRLGVRRLRGGGQPGVHLPEEPPDPPCCHLVPPPVRRLPPVALVALRPRVAQRSLQDIELRVSCHLRPPWLLLPGRCHGLEPMGRGGARLCRALREACDVGYLWKRW